MFCCSFFLCYARPLCFPQFSDGVIVMLMGYCAYSIIMWDLSADFPMSDTLLAVEIAVFPVTFLCCGEASPHAHMCFILLFQAQVDAIETTNVRMYI